MRSSQVSSPKHALLAFNAGLAWNPQHSRGRRDEVDRAPMVGGVITSCILELLIYPPIFTIWKWWAEVRSTQRDSEVA